MIGEHTAKVTREESSDAAITILGAVHVKLNYAATRA